MIPSVFNDYSPSLLGYALLGVQDGLHHHEQMGVYVEHAKMRESMILQAMAVSSLSLVYEVEVCLQNFLQPIVVKPFSPPGL